MEYVKRKIRPVMNHIVDGIAKGYNILKVHLSRLLPQFSAEISKKKPS